MSFFNIVAATNEDTVVAAYEPSKVRSDSYQSEADWRKNLSGCCASRAIPICRCIPRMN